jgi:hypothetical protein
MPWAVLVRKDTAFWRKRQGKKAADDNWVKGSKHEVERLVKERNR